MTEICILLINISIWILFFIVQNNYKSLNNKLLEQKAELEKQFNDKCFDIECKYHKDMIDFISEIEYVLINKAVKTKKKK